MCGVACCRACGRRRGTTCRASRSCWPPWSRRASSSPAPASSSRRSCPTTPSSTWRHALHHRAVRRTRRAHTIQWPCTLAVLARPVQMFHTAQLCTAQLHRSAYPFWRAAGAAAGVRAAGAAGRGARRRPLRRDRRLLRGARVPGHRPRRHPARVPGCARRLTPLDGSASKLEQWQHLAHSCFTSCDAPAIPSYALHRRPCILSSCSTDARCGRVLQSARQWRQARSACCC